MSSFSDSEEELDRVDFFILGILLHQAHENPRDVKLRAQDVADWSTGFPSYDIIMSRVPTLEKLAFILINNHTATNSKPVDPLQAETNPLLEITAAGIAYVVENAYDISHQVHGTTWDMPQEIEDTLDDLVLGKTHSPLRIDETVDLPLGGLLNLGAPASDRYVSTEDNQEKIAEIVESLSELIAAINDDRTNDFDDKRGRIADLLTLDFMLKQDQICVPVVEQILRDTGLYLAKKFADNAVGIAANALLLLAASFFGFHF